MLTPSHIFPGLIYSTFVSDLYGLIRCILFPIYIGEYCILTVPLIKYRVITNWHLYGDSYLYLEWLLIMTLSTML